MGNIECQRSSLARRSKLHQQSCQVPWFSRLTFCLRRYPSLKCCFVLQWLFFLIELGTSVGLIGVVIMASLLSTCIVFFIQTFMSYLCFGRMTNLLNESLHAYVSEEKSKWSAKQAHPGSSNIFLLWLEPTVAHLLRNFSLESH